MRREFTIDRPMMRLGPVALVALMLASCSVTPDSPYNFEGNTPEAVVFSAYLQRDVETRAGAPGELKTSSGTSLQDEGFGVFGYHSDAALYSQASLPNFMYNTKVSTSSWTYSPVKYWPNEFGTEAQSENIDRLTFFAYAPYVAVSPSTGALSVAETSDPSTSHSTGITRLTRSTDSGDPMVSYAVSFKPAHCVDLCWGVAKADFTSSLGSTEGTNSITAGSPFVNVARPKVADKISFQFEHALAALNMQIDAVVAGEPLNAAQTRIYVRSVSFEGFADKASLNLNSSTTTGPQWVGYYGTGAVSTSRVTVYDGLRDGREAVATASTETPANLNPVIIQSAKYSETPKAGVTTTAVNLFDGAAATDPVYVIPNGDELKVTITYDVETRDPKILGTLLADGEEHGSVVENTITKTISGITLQAGTKYTVTLHLGLNSVDFEASVSAWSAESATEVGLPQNS